MINKLNCLSENKKLLCICNADSVVKFWDTSTNVLEYEFHPGIELSSSVTCLQFTPKNTLRNFKNKKKKLSEPQGISELLLALGTEEGCVLVYNVVRQKVMTSLCHSTCSPVADVQWHSTGNEIVSVGDKKLILWDINNKSKLYTLDVIDCSSLCVLNLPNRFVVAGTAIQVLSYDAKTETVDGDNWFPFHKRTVIQISAIVVENTTEEYFFSVADNDRYIYAWSLSAIAEKNSVACFTAKDAVKMFSVICDKNSNVKIGSVTKKGFLRIFTHFFNGKKSPKPIPFETNIRVESKGNCGTILPILRAEFSTPNEIILVYGTEFSPLSERIDISTLDENTCLLRSDPSNFSIKNQKVKSIKAVTPHVPDTAVHLMPVQMKPLELKEVNSKRKKGNKEITLPMEERLNTLSLTAQSSDWPGGRPLDNYVHLLVQGLHSKDSGLLNSILSRGEDEDVIEKTVRRLPVANVVPFLHHLQSVILEKGVKNLTCVNWIKSVLVHHMSHLSAVPEKETLLGPFGDAFKSRLPSLLAVSKLHARISLLLTHVKSRHESSASTGVHASTGSSGGNGDQFCRPLAYYREESSDDDDLRVDIDGVIGGGGGVHSESSEDIWDEWTEDELEQGGEGGDSGQESGDDGQESEDDGHGDGENGDDGQESGDDGHGDLMEVVDGSGDEVESEG